MPMETAYVGSQAFNAMTGPVGQIVHPERIWLTPIQDNAASSPERSVRATRWAGFAATPQEQASEIRTECHVLAIALRPMDLTAFHRGKLIHDGIMQPGTMRMSEPGLALRGIFRGAYDALHLHIRNTVIAECIQSASGQPGNIEVPFASSEAILDPVIERLSHALIRADDCGPTFGRCYAESVGLAIVARLLGRSAGSAPAATGSRVSSLPKWRLRRATEFIAAHLGEPIGLAEIAASTGLTRMHFAAQFKAATGMRPHEYLVQKRIERAQHLLAGSQMSLAEVALEVGFKAQAHFTTVFVRIAGATPNAWRRQHNTGGPR